MADTSPSFSTRHSVLSSSGKDDLYSILGGSNGAENRPLATYPVKQFSREKRGTRVATPAIMGTLANSPRYTLASRNFTRLSSFFFSHAERKRYDILFRLFPRFARERVFLWKKNPLAMHRLVSRIFLLRECRETTYLAIIRERIPLEFLSRYYQWIFNSQR